MKLEDHCFNAAPPGQPDAVSCVTLSMALATIEQARQEVSDMWLNAVTSVVSAKQAQEISHALLAQRNPCKHTNARCVYDSADGEFARWQCRDCGHRWGVEIPQ